MGLRFTVPPFTRLVRQSLNLLVYLPTSLMTTVLKIGFLFRAV